MRQYQDLIKHILENGEDVSDRTGVGTKSVFGYQMRFNLQEGFPAVTTKKLAWKAVVGELIWFLEGSTDERRLAELTYGKHRVDLADKTTIWTANADGQGKTLGYVNDKWAKHLGPVYGAQWRNFNPVEHRWKTVDQIDWLVKEIKSNPDSRRLILSAWNPLQISEMALPPCHVLAQFRVINGKLNCQMYQRSADSFLGIPFNIASYALLTHIIARECNLKVGDFIHTIGDAHIYNNHIDQCKLLLEREPLPLPTLEITEDFELMPRLNSAFEIHDVNKFKLTNYISHDKIIAEMAV